MNKPMRRLLPNAYGQRVNTFTLAAWVRCLVVLSLASPCVDLHAQGLGSMWKTGKKTPSEFILPRDEDPQGISPAHWGLVDKRTMPAEIPSLQQPTQPTSRWADYEPATPFGKYQPSQLSVAYQNQPVQNNGANYPPAYAPQEQVMPVSSGPSLLRMSPEQEAFQASPFHVKEPSPSLGDVLKTGAWFASYESLIVEPHFQGNTAITTESATSGFSRAFDTGLEHAPLVNFGFESKKGPGIMLTYWQIDANSDLASAVGSATDTASSSVWLMGPQRTTTLTAAGGERLEARHSLDIKSLSAVVFKEIKMPISRVKGQMGMKYVNLNQIMHADLFNSGNNRIGLLHGYHDFRGFGPTIGLEYYRPIGHTRIEFLGGANSALLFGHRNQFVANPTMQDFNYFGSDELIAYMDARLGAQWIRDFGKNRVFIRGTLESQVWFGGGTAADPLQDFGLYGFGIGFGLNH